MTKYSKCVWCGITIEITGKDRELCKDCEQYPSFSDMLKAKFPSLYEIPKSVPYKE